MQTKRIRSWVISMGLSLTALAAPFDVPIAVSQLERLNFQLHQLRKLSHTHNEGRIYLFELTGRKLRDEVEKDGLTASSLQGYLSLLTQIECATDILEFMVTDQNRPTITAIFDLTQTISNSVGVKGGPPRLIEVHVKELRRAIRDLLALNVLSRKLANDLVGLNADFLNLSSRAAQGDVAAARTTQAFYEKMLTLYPALKDEATFKPAYELYLEIQGTNEFLGSYVREIGRQSP